MRTGIHQARGHSDSPERLLMCLAAQPLVFARMSLKQVWPQATTKLERKMPLSGESPHFGLMFFTRKNRTLEPEYARTQIVGVGVNAPVDPNTRNLRREILSLS